MKISIKQKRHPQVPSRGVAPSKSATSLQCPPRRRSLGDKSSYFDSLAALDDGDRREFSALDGEDGHLGVAAVAFGVEGDPPGSRRRIPFLQLPADTSRVRRISFFIASISRLAAS